jgi:hypothetical protein
LLARLVFWALGQKSGCLVLHAGFQLFHKLAFGITEISISRPDALNKGNLWDEGMLRSTGTEVLCVALGKVYCLLASSALTEHSKTL